MSQSIDLLTLTVRATAAIRRGRFVSFAGTEVTTQGAKAIGVARHAAAIGEDVAVVVCGTAVVEAGAAVAVGATVASDTQGRAIVPGPLTIVAGATPVTSTAANGATILTGSDMPGFAIGDALQAATAAGQFIEILLRR